MITSKKRAHSIKMGGGDGGLGKNRVSSLRTEKKKGNFAREAQTESQYHIVEKK